MLPRNRKPRRNQPKPSFTNDVDGDIDASTSIAAAEDCDGEEVQDSDAPDLSNFASPASTSPGHSHWNSFIEPRKPFALAWKVRVTDDRERDNHDGKNNTSGIQGAGVESGTALGGDDERRNNDVNSAVDTTAFSVDKRGVIMMEAGSTRGYVCRPRDPTWARLIFAERKR